MNKKFKKFVIPALAATILTGGSYNYVAHAQSKDKPVVEAEVNDAQEQATLTKQATITEEAASKTALEKVPGTVQKVELEDEDGTVVYGIEVKAKDGSEQDVKVDAKTGKIVKVENDDENGKEENDKE
ncbi:PepSY domain-containing protein [Peribacillus loiseleuriae]|uniref:PepSY domain-containing protein n=1 Tax=Peribacillus loiseleuriae TaxID=1679170 RepID=UPI003CFD408B